MLSESANPTLADAQKALEGKLALPTVDGSNRNMRRLQIWALTLLPSDHPIQRYLGERFMDIESFKLDWQVWSPLKPEHAAAKGVLHLKKDSYQAIGILERAES